jgi:MFS family permease
MAWGILEDLRTPLPPGTVLLDDFKQQIVVDDGNNPDVVHLKKDGHIILQPQPCDSPNDPLNWSIKRKTGILITMFVTMNTIGGLLTMLSTGYRKLAEQYHVKYPVVISTISPPGIITNAIAGFFASAIAAVWGKRIGIVVGVFMMWCNMFAGQFANSLKYYQGLSIVNGIAGAPAELLLSPMIADLMFIHQRGRLMAFSSMVHVVGGDAA